jgi:hypothetical protein
MRDKYIQGTRTEGTLLSVPTSRIVPKSQYLKDLEARQVSKTATSRTASNASVSQTALSLVKGG